MRTALFMTSLVLAADRRPGRSTPRRGLTLIEILIVCVVVLILAAIVFPLLVEARGRAQDASETAMLRQFAVAARLYGDANDGRTVFDSASLVLAGDLDRRLLSSPVDVWREGLANRVRAGMANEQRVRPYRDSFPVLADFVGEHFLPEVEASSGAGWMIAAGRSGSRMAPHDNWPKGRFQRLRFDGAIVSRTFVWTRLEHGETSTPYHAFTDEPVLDRHRPRR
jgi:prepilin-type N-terminal cleavage/methylation domain-containing protein